MDQISIKTPNPIYRVYRMEIHSVMLVFSTPLVNLRPTNLLTDSSNPLPHLPCVNKYRGMYYVFIECVTGGGSGASDR